MDFKTFITKTKGIIQQTWQLAANPREAWIAIAERNETWHETQSQFLFPMFLLLTLLIIVRVAFTLWWDIEANVSGEIIAGLSEIMVFTIGFYLTAAIRSATYNLKGSHILSSILSKELVQNTSIEDIRKDTDERCTFLAYAEALMLISQCVMEIIPWLGIIIQFANVYSVYIIWHGYYHYMRRVGSEDKGIWFAISTAAIIYFIPYIMTWGARRIFIGM